MTTVRFAEDNNIIVEIESCKNGSTYHIFSCEEKNFIMAARLNLIPLVPPPSPSKKRKLNEILDEQEKYTSGIPCAEAYLQTLIGDETEDYEYDSDDERPPIIYGTYYTRPEWEDHFQDSSPEMEDNFQNSIRVPEDNFEDDDLVKEFESYVKSGY